MWLGEAFAEQDEAAEAGNRHVVRKSVGQDEEGRRGGRQRRPVVILRKALQQQRNGAERDDDLRRSVKVGIIVMKKVPTSPTMLACSRAVPVR